TTTTYSHSTSDDGDKNNGQTSSVYCKGMGGLVLVPLMAPTTTATTSTTSTSSKVTTTSTTASTTTTSAKTCSAGKMVPVYGDEKPGDTNSGNVLGAGQCVDLTFSGPITFPFGQTSITIIPSTAAGQTYVLGALGSSEAVKVSCKLPVTPTSCTEIAPRD